MDSRNSRWLALGASSAVALAILWVGWRWIEGRDRQTLRMHLSERPDLAPRAAATARGGRAVDPVEPEEWRFHLDEKEADAYFAISRNTRVVYDPWMAMREIPHENAVMKWKEHPDGEFVFRTNSLGCREDHELDDPPRDLRVLVAGDSHTCGICNNSESFANRLEAALAARRPQKTAEVLNTGLGGYTFYNYLGALYRFRGFRPQVFVVAIFGGNDFGDFYPLFLRFTNGSWPKGTPEQDLRRRRALEISGDAMGQGLASLDLMRNFEAERGTMADAAVQMCVEMHRVAALQGTAVVFLYIPSPFELPWPEPVGRYERTRDALELTDADFAILSRIADRALEGLRARGLRTIDMRPVFAAEPEPPYWRADFHLDLRGHELIAAALEPVVEELLTRE